MAVTNTVAAPAAAIDKLYIGSYGVSDGSVFVSVGSETFAQKRVKAAKFTLSGTYATGGFALVPSAFGLKEIHGLTVICDNNSTSGAGAVPRLTTTGASPIVKLFSDTTTELANTTSVANYVYAVQVIGV